MLDWKSYVHLAGLLVFLGAGSCSAGPSSISAKDYPRSCATAAECSAVFEGAVPCCGGGCPNTAIRKDAAPRFMTDSEAARTASCDGVQPPCPSGPICAAPQVTCDKGVCGLAPPQTDAAQE
jgi:hypothetical protein